MVSLLTLVGCFPTVMETPASVPTATLHISPTASAGFAPELEIRDVNVSETSIGITVCFVLPSADKDWVLGRLPGDVYLSDGRHTVPLQAFSLVAFEEQSDPASTTRCDRFNSDLPPDFHIEQATLTVERVSASMPDEIDWEQVLERVERAEPGVVIEPMQDEPGPSFAVVETPPDMTDLEAHNLVVGVIEPVVIGPWSVPLAIDPQ